MRARSAGKVARGHLLGELQCVSWIARSCDWHAEGAKAEWAIRLVPEGKAWAVELRWSMNRAVVGRGGQMQEREWRVLPPPLRC